MIFKSTLFQNVRKTVQNEIFIIRTRVKYLISFSDIFPASTSLLRWATDEPNHDLKENIRRIYDINLIWASVQKGYIEQVCKKKHFRLMEFSQY